MSTAQKPEGACAVPLGTISAPGIWSWRSGIKRPLRRAHGGLMNDNTALIIQCRESGSGPKCGNSLCQNPFQPKKKHAPIQ